MQPCRRDAVAWPRCARRADRVAFQARKSSNHSARFCSTARGTCSDTFPHRPTTTRPMSTAMLNVRTGCSTRPPVRAHSVQPHDRTSTHKFESQQFSCDHKFVKWENSCTSTYPKCGSELPYEALVGGCHVTISALKSIEVERNSCSEQNEANVL